jgi:tripartite-type tricarboxylate transporter receptor subunit TctC
MCPSKTYALAALAALLCAAPAANAQTYPAKPVKLVVPFTPGGSTDVIARLLAVPLGARLQQPIVIENKPGAGTMLGADAVAKSPADGYTLLLSAATTYTVNPVVYKKLPYDAATAFEPLGIVGSTGLVLLANPSLRASTLKEAIAEVKADPAGASYASFGNGTTSHFAGEMINAATGIKLLHVPYKGSGPAMVDLIGNQVRFSVDTVVAAMPQIKAGKVKAIAVTSATRSAHLPQVPTVVESGYPSVVLSTWFAIVAPGGLPAGVHDTLEAAIAAVMKDPATRKALADNGYEPEYGTPAQYRERVAQEAPRLRAIAESAKITPD